MVENDAKLSRSVSARSPHAFEVLLCRNLEVKSNAGGAGVWKEIPVGPGFPGLAAHLDNVVIHVVHEKQSNPNLNHRVSIEWSADGFAWDGAAIVVASNNNEGYKISPTYSTRTSFGRFIRFSLGLEDDGSSYTGVFSIWVMIKLWS